MAGRVGQGPYLWGRGGSSSGCRCPRQGCSSSPAEVKITQPRLNNASKTQTPHKPVPWCVQGSLFTMGRERFPSNNGGTHSLLTQTHRQRRTLIAPNR